MRYFVVLVGSVNTKEQSLTQMNIIEKYFKKKLHEDSKGKGYNQDVYA
jgi:hypothetical protein